MKILKKVARGIINVLIFLTFSFPFFWLVSSSLKTLGETLTFPPSLLPKDPQWQNFVAVTESMEFTKYLKNSIIVSVSTVLLQMVTVTLAAYALARYRFAGRELAFGMVLVTMMVPTQLTFLTVYVMFAKLDMINTYATLILPSATSAYGIFMLRQAFMRIPDELIEAARLDNASEMTIVRKIMMPIARPTIVTLALLTFIGTWNEYFWPLTMTTNDTVRTLPVGVTMLIDQEAGTNHHILMAGNVLLILPILIIYLIAHKQIIKAFTYTGEK